MKTSAASALASLQRSARHFATQAEPLIGLKPGKPTREWLQSLRRLARRREQPEGKHIHAGLILERYPICLPENPGWKSEFRQWQKDWNAWKYKTAKPGWLDCSRPTTDDSDSARFEPEDVVTEADRANDVRSLRRNTRGWLYLAVKPIGTGGAAGQWQLPIAPVTSDDASIRGATQRWLSDTFGNTAEAFVVGNVPACVLPSQNAQTFYMMGVMLDGLPEIQPGASISDFAWLTLSELQEAQQGHEAMQGMLRTVLVEK